MSKSKAVAKKEEGGALAAWGDYAGNETGFEGSDSSDLAIPFINLLQSNSEMVEEDKAKAGQFFNNVMETVNDELRIVPCAVQRNYVEWVPIDDGGGLIGVHDPNSQLVQDAIAANGGSNRDLKCNDGAHELLETKYLYALVLDDEGNYERAVISFTSSKLKKFKQFFTKAMSQQLRVGDRKITLPLWAHRYVLGSEEEISKRNGKKFKNVTLGFDADTAPECRYTPADEIFQAANAFHDMVLGGEAKADLSQERQAGGGNENPGDDTSGDIPF